MIQVANFLWLAINMTGAMLFLRYQDLHLQAEFVEVKEVSDNKTDEDSSRIKNSWSIIIFKTFNKFEN